MIVLGPTTLIRMTGINSVCVSRKHKWIKVGVQHLQKVLFGPAYSLTVKVYSVKFTAECTIRPCLQSYSISVQCTAECTV